MLDMFKKQDKTVKRDSTSTSGYELSFREILLTFSDVNEFKFKSDSLKSNQQRLSQQPTKKLKVIEESWQEEDYNDV